MSENVLFHFELSGRISASDLRRLLFELLSTEFEPATGDALEGGGKADFWIGKEYGGFTYTLRGPYRSSGSDTLRYALDLEVDSTDPLFEYRTKSFPVDEFPQWIQSVLAGEGLQCVFASMGRDEGDRRLREGTKGTDDFK